MKAAAQRFAALAWPAFFVLVVTGIWNLLEVDIAAASSRYQTSLGLKLLFVTGAGFAVAAHSMAERRAVIAAGGAIGLLCSLGALLVGVQLSGG